jgi:RimJ/RimL family protein N-acetyltransferase
MEKNNKINLKLVRKSDLKFLYEMLSERNSNVNISHKIMPSYDDHVKFVNSKPYAKWYIILFNNTKCGSIYLSKQDEIGIFLKKNTHCKGIGTEAMNILMKRNPRLRYLANINPKNTKSIKFFKQNNYKLLQYTYELITE